MKTTPELIFEKIIKTAFHAQLKPLDFKKKSNNFFRDLGEFGHLVNLQKSMSSTREEIKFTINVSLFSKDVWAENYNFHQTAMPEFPSEPVCFSRNRIGKLLGSNDVWYKINPDSDADELCALFENLVFEVILPFYRANDSVEKLIENLLQKRWLSGDEETWLLIFLVKSNRKEEAKALLEKKLAVASPKDYLLKVAKKWDIH